MIAVTLPDSGCRPELEAGELAEDRVATFS